MDSGLPVHIASTVVAISVVVEAPLIFFSDRFMDHWPLRVLIALPIGIIFAQYAVYALPSPVFLKVIMTLLAKHDRDGFDYGLLTVYRPTGKWQRLGSCHGHCPRSSLFRTILLQPLAAALCIERGGYQVMSFFSRGCRDRLFAEFLP